MESTYGVLLPFRVQNPAELRTFPGSSEGVQQVLYGVRSARALPCWSVLPGAATDRRNVFGSAGSKRRSGGPEEGRGRKEIDRGWKPLPLRFFAYVFFFGGGLALQGGVKREERRM